MSVASDTVELSVETAEACGLSPESEIVGAVTLLEPAAGGLECLACDVGAACLLDKNRKVRTVRQPPAFGACGACRFPGVEPSHLGTFFGIAVRAGTPFGFVRQVLGHPQGVPDLHGLVRFPVARVGERFGAAAEQQNSKQEKGSLAHDYDRLHQVRDFHLKNRPFTFWM